MTTLNVIPVILAGGVGTRLWPVSRESYPKQFLNLIDSQYSLFQQTVLRAMSLEGSAKPIVVGNESHRFLILDQLHQIKQNAQIILESSSKNTAPSVTLSALCAMEQYSDAILLVMPADHVIENEQKFHKAVEIAVQQVSQNTEMIVTLGIVPHKAETGYGYMQYEQITDDCYQVKQFVEKPDGQTAEAYVARGDYLWNAGIFILKASTWLRAIAQYELSISEYCQKSWLEKSYDTPFIRPEKSYFEQIIGNSIDYAVIEHCPNEQFDIQVVPLDAGWNDLGSWQAVAEQSIMQQEQSDKQIVIDSSECLVYGDKLVALVGVKDLIVVETADAILVVDKNSSQKVKNVVEQLHSQGRSEHLIHRKVHRPWGWYDSIEQAERFKVKRICVKPKASLSLQKHYHRAEHWVVVKGTAEVTCGDKTILLTENQSTYIPLGEIHRLSNPGHIPLEIIEIQTGGYLEEDDIVRFADDYGR